MFREELYESGGVDYVCTAHRVLVICRGLVIRGLTDGNDCIFMQTHTREAV